MRSLSWSKSLFLCLLVVLSMQCGRSKSATNNTSNTGNTVISPNNAPNQAEIDSIKQIETLKKEEYKPQTPPK